MADFKLQRAAWFLVWTLTFQRVHCWVGLQYSIRSNDRRNQRGYWVQRSARQGSNEQAPQEEILIEPDYLVTNSNDLIDRPSLAGIVLESPQNVGAIAMVVVGLVLTGYNVLGLYTGMYLQWQRVCVLLGLALAAGDGLAIGKARTYYNGDKTIDPRRSLSPNLRLGVSDDAVVHGYAAVYTIASAWLSVRASPVCPEVISQLDVILGGIATIVFVLSLLLPILTLLQHHGVISTLESALQGLVRWIRNHPGTNCDAKNPRLVLTETELLRVRGLLAIGVIGCVFAPDAVSFALGSQEWWGRVTALHPSQAYLESSTALYGVLATQASMIAHRAAKTGVTTLDSIVPSFAAVCFVLAVVPCACALYWLGGDISFFSFYRE